MARTVHGMPGVYNASSITLTDGEGSALAVDVNGITKVSVVSGGSSTAQGTYNTSPPTLTNGSTNSVQLDVNGNLMVVEQKAPAYENNTDSIAWVHPRPISSSTAAITIDQSTALEASTVTKASAGRFYGTYGRIDKTAATGDYWIQVLNAASLPADGAVTILTVIKKTHTNGTDTPIDLDLIRYGLYGSTGLVVVLSTTEFTKTIAGAYLSLTVLYA